VLTVLDRRWREHLYEMDYLREGIGLRAMAQRNPLVEYQREGFDMFSAMMDGIKEESVGLLFNVEVQQPAEQDLAGEVLIAKGLVSASTPAQLEYTAPSIDEADGVEHHTERVTSDGGAVEGESGLPGDAEAGRSRGRRTRSRGRRR
jgi:preprotein translocase subunit SecA